MRKQKFSRLKSNKVSIVKKLNKHCFTYSHSFSILTYLPLNKLFSIFYLITFQCYISGKLLSWVSHFYYQPVRCQDKIYNWLSFKLSLYNFRLYFKVPYQILFIQNNFYRKYLWKVYRWFESNYSTDEKVFLRVR